MRKGLDGIVKSIADRRDADETDKGLTRGGLDPVWRWCGSMVTMERVAGASTEATLVTPE